MKSEEIKPFLWGVAVAAIAVPSVLLWQGWIVTNGSAQATATEMTKAAVIENLTPICIAQFSEDAARDEQLVALKALDSWKRKEFVLQQGWATMPGSDSGDSKVAYECAERIAALEI